MEGMLSCLCWPGEDATSNLWQGGTRTFLACLHSLAFTQPTASPKVLETMAMLCGAQERANFIHFPTAPLPPAGCGDCIHPPGTKWEKKVMPWHSSRELLYGAEGKTGVRVQ